MVQTGAADDDQPQHRNRIAEYLGSADFWTALATFFLVLVGIWGVVETRDALEASQRAWITPLGAQLGRQLDADQGVRFFVTLVNPGREPAVDVTVKIKNRTIDSYNPLYVDMSDIVVPENTACDGLVPISGRATISPTGQNTGIAFILDSRHGDPQLLVDDRILKGDKFYVVLGCIAYRTYDKPRKSAFCYILERGVPIQQMGPANALPSLTPPQNMTTGEIGGGFKLPNYKPIDTHTFNFAPCSKGFAAT